jgi:tol-pal system protein YbgF
MLLLNRYLILTVFTLASPLLTAQVQVVEAGGARNQSQPAANDNQNEIVINMYLQLEALQAEVQNLRGLVEEQSYQIRRMQTEQRDRYLDTDSRLNVLQNQIASPGRAAPAITQAPPPVTPVESNSTAGGNGAAAANGNADQSPAQPAVTNTPRSEQDIYRQALALLLEKEEYQDSITLFQQYIDIYPQGRYFTNALYWQGAALELVGSYDRAIEVLTRLIDNHPQDAKAPTAMLRLGTVYREMGRKPEALATWRRISEVYPDSTSEIEIANEYLGDANNF